MIERAFGKTGAHMAESQVPGVSAAGGAAVRAGLPVLEVNHVEKVYGSRNNVTRALADVSFAVDKGEFVGIMGASGSGKSTLLNCVSTLGIWQVHPAQLRVHHRYRDERQRGHQRRRRHAHEARQAHAFPSRAAGFHFPGLQFARYADGPREHRPAAHHRPRSRQGDPRARRAGRPAPRHCRGARQVSVSRGASSSTASWRSSP